MSWKRSPAAVLITLLVIHMLAHIDRNMLLGFSPQITRDLALSNAQYGFLAGAVWVLSFGFMAVFMGSLADRFSRTRVMAVGILIWSACTAASGAAQSFEQMVAARLLVATGEAALVPAAVSLLIDLFQARRAGTAVGLFFMGIPLGIGLSFLLAGTLGASHGWRDTFFMLGVIGVVIGLPMLLLQDKRGVHGDAERGAPFAQQLRNVIAALRATPTVLLTITGFVLVHFAFVGLAFAQLWLVRERGFDAAAIARQIGGLQIVFGILGAVVGGVLSDRLARRIKGGHAGFMVLLIAICGPLMVAYRFAPAGSALFYIGMCAGFFLPLAAYGPSLALIQGLTPDRMRSTVTGFTMLLINVFAIAIGNLAVGTVSDSMTAAGSTHALTAVLLATDVLVMGAALFFILAARGPRVQSAPAGAVAH
jgi:predicted MFS family arabinose efflux permease